METGWENRNTKVITRLMIDAAVDRGIKEMAEDPKRAVRKLADMGKQFSTGRFQSQTFDIIQTLLENDDSPYYALIERVLQNTDHRVLKRFGINMGYGSWTWGARAIRRVSEQKGYQIPWLIIFHYHPSATGGPGVDAGTIRRIVGEALPLGINTFAVFRDSALMADRELLVSLPVTGNAASSTSCRMRRSPRRRRTASRAAATRWSS